MELDLKGWLTLIATFIGIISTIITLALRFMPRESDKLKHNLELLKLAKESEINHLPIAREVEAQIQNLFIDVPVSRLKIYRTQILLFTMICFLIAVITGTGTSYIATIFFGMSENDADHLVSQFVVAGIIGGISFGLMSGSEQYKKELELAELKKKEIMDSDRSKVDGQVVSNTGNGL
ncbi:TPA: hypothetical protein ACGUOU_004553 [Vibrio vulnificus]|nr:hypothetical protein [Vibrio vulnificus]